MPPRFFCAQLPDPALSEAGCALDADESRHAQKVLRLAPGDACELFDGAGVVARAELTGYAQNRAQLRVLSRRREEPPRPRLAVAAAVPKGPRAQDMANQLGQLGVDAFVPLRCERGVVDPGPNKLERYRLAALAAAKQSGRATVMKVRPAETVADVLAAEPDLGLILDPGGRSGAALELPGRLATCGAATVLVGPEGGWTDAERQSARDAGFLSWRVAPHVLRIETAAVAAAAVVRHAALQGN